MKKPRTYFPLFLGLFIFLADLLSKYFVHQHIPVIRHSDMWYPYGGIGVFKNFMGIEFSIGHVTNRGAVWGVLADFQEYLLVLRIILIAAMVVYLVFINKNPTWRIPLVLIIVGAFGNVLDFFFYGHVVDMFHFIFWGYDYPVFNVADAAICIGIFWLFFASLKDKPAKAKS